MAKSICFTNQGEIDPRTITTFGVNVKPNSDSPIGYFGTGLKYAIAIALRHRCTVTVQSGLREFRFYPKNVDIRGKAFDLVMMLDGDLPEIELPMTLELGKNWDLWMVYRELLCNALDEGSSLDEAAQVINSKPLATAGLTRVIISGDQFLTEHFARAKWLLLTSPMHKVDSVLELHRGPAQGLFFKNIRISHLPVESAFSYNLTELTYGKLSEDRTLDSHTAMVNLVRAFALSETVEVGLLESLLLAQHGWEKKWDWTWCFSDPSSRFVKVVDDLIDGHYGTINRSAIDFCKSKLSKRTPKEVELTAVQAKMLAKAKQFVAKLGEPIGEKIVVVEDLGSQWNAGLASEGIIYLPKSSFGRGTKFIASTLLEEHLHISKGLRDESRELQDWLFNFVISLGEELQGEPL